MNLNQYLAGVSSLALAISISTSQALAWTHGISYTTGSTLCPYGSSLGDGCPSAPTANANTFQNPNFFYGSGNVFLYNHLNASTNGYVAQGTGSFTGSIGGAGNLTLTVSSSTGIAQNQTLEDGQINVPLAGVVIGTQIDSTHWNISWGNNTPKTVASTSMVTVNRPPWNVAGVDYPTGICKPTDACANGWNGTFLDPVANSASLPTGCTINGTTYYYVKCTGTNNITFNGWDFSLHSGISLYVPGNTGTFNITNSKFVRGAGIAGGAGNNWMIMFNDNNGAVTIANNYIDDNAQNFTVAGYIGPIFCACYNGAVSSSFNVWLHSAGHGFTGPSGVGGSPTLTISNEYIQDTSYDFSGHGEWLIFGNDIGPIGATLLKYDTILNTSTFYAGQTANYFLTSGNSSGPTSVGDMNMNHNVSVNQMGAITGHTNTTPQLIIDSMIPTCNSAPLLTGATSVVVPGVGRAVLNSFVSGTCNGGPGTYGLASSLGTISSQLMYITPSVGFVFEPGYTGPPSIEISDNWFDASGSSGCMNMGSVGPTPTNPGGPNVNLIDGSTISLPVAGGVASCNGQLGGY